MSTMIRSLTTVGRSKRYGIVAAPGARIAGLRRQPMRRLQNPLATCPILDRLSTAPDAPVRPGGRVPTVLLLLLLLL